MKGMKDSVQLATPNSFPHNLTHQVDTTADLFQFRPVFCEEMYPTDHFKISVADYFRAEPLAGPVYASYIKKYSAFFVPYRILWEHWNDYLTGGANGRLEFKFPHVKLWDIAQLASDMYHNIDLGAGYPKHRSAIYRNMMDMWSDLGLPIDWLFQRYDSDHTLFRQELEDFDFPIFRWLACRNIWFDWFRDQNLISDDMRDDYCPKSFGTTGRYVPSTMLEDYWSFNTDENILFAPLPVSVEKDYFTTAMTEPQRGGAAFVPVRLPSADVNPGMSLPTTGNQALYANASGSVGVGTSGAPLGNDIIGMFDILSERVSKAAQRYCEKNNVAGSSDLQQLLAHWGTAPNPAVFGRSTYIGSFEDRFNPTEVVSPIENTETLMGQVSTKVNAAGTGSFEYTANEHGFFIIVQTIRPENQYVGGIRREVMHGCLGNGRFDFGTPEMEATGFQPQYTWELCTMQFVSNFKEGPIDGVRGYVPRYAELKRSYNRCTGQMQTDLFRYLRCARDFGRWVQMTDEDLFQNTDFTMIYGYPVDFPYDLVFADENPFLDHFQGWIKFFWESNRPFHSYAAPLIEDVKGDDITLPYAGVRM